MIEPRYRQQTLYEQALVSFMPDYKKVLWERWMLKVDEVLEALLPKKSFIVMPTCSCSSSGSVRAALFWISSAVMTVALAGKRRTTSGKRVALTTTESSFCEWAGKAKAADNAMEKARRIGNPSGVDPDAMKKVEKGSKAGLRTRE